jgi:site-specific recombinase XerD
MAYCVDAESPVSYGLILQRFVETLEKREQIRFFTEKPKSKKPAPPQCAQAASAEALFSESQRISSDNGFSRKRHLRALIPAKKERRRYYPHESQVQEPLKRAAKKAKLTKRFKSDTFRRSFATHLLLAN